VSDSSRGGHLTDEDLILLHYGEPVGDEARDHAGSCAECAARRRGLAELLGAVALPEPPARPADYADRVWARLEPRLDAPAKVLRPGRWGRRILGLSALAASLLVAFLLGRVTKPGPQPLAPEVRERILVVAVGEHLDRSQMILVELAHAGGQGPVDVSAERAWAGELVSANRLYRQTAARAGDTALTSVLEELERVLVEVAAGPDQLSPADLADLQHRIESRGILFKVRVVGSEMRQRGRTVPPASPATVS
jgi:hypothetical protein